MEKLTFTLFAACLLQLPAFALAEEIDLNAFAQRFIAAERQAWIDGDFSALEAIEDTGVTYHGYGIESFEDHKQYISAFRETQTVQLMELDFLTSDGSLFAADYHSLTTTDGLQTETKALMLFRVSPDKGKITDVWLGVNSTPVVD